MKCSNCSRPFIGEDCPKWEAHKYECIGIKVRSADDIIVLISKEKKRINITYSEAVKSRTLRDLLEFSNDDEIPLPIKYSTLEDIKKYLQYQYDIVPTLDIIMAANYLDMEYVMSVATSSYVRGGYFMNQVGLMRNVGYSVEQVQQIQTHFALPKFDKPKPLLLQDGQEPQITHIPKGILLQYIFPNLKWKEILVVRLCNIRFYVVTTQYLARVARVRFPNLGKASQMIELETRMQDLSKSEQARWAKEFEDFIIKWGSLKNAKERDPYQQDEDRKRREYYASGYSS